VDARDGEDAARFAEVERIELADGRVTAAVDAVAREEPLEIRIGGVPIAVVMRTPGHDEELVRGFLLTEGIVAEPSQVASVRHCTTVTAADAEENVVQVVLAPGHEVDLARLRRNLYASSSCGICGKATLEQALARAPELHDGAAIDPEILYALPGRLRGAQSVFDRTGGLHAAGLFTPAGECLVVREDVGRHNAVDKVVGWAVAGGRSLAGHVLMVSGRVSFEVVQKALAAKIPIVAAVSAPSSLAVELARASGMTLVGFLRDRRACVYAHPGRISP
jgi:FdhD protein